MQLRLRKLRARLWLHVHRERGVYMCSIELLVLLQLVVASFLIQNTVACKVCMMPVVKFVVKFENL